MFEELNAHRQAVRENIEKAFEVGFTGNTDFEKAHQVGDVHPNGKWVWTQLPSGKYDWRVIKKTNTSSGGSASSAPKKQVSEGKKKEDAEIKIKIEDWLDYNKQDLTIKFDSINDSITSDNKLVLKEFHTQFAEDTPSMKLPAPDYIKIKDVIDLTSLENYKDPKYLDNLPPIDHVSNMAIHAASINSVKQYDLTDLPIKAIDKLYIDVNARVDVIGFPTKTKIDIVNYRYNQISGNKPEYSDHIYRPIKDAKTFFKGLNTKTLVIPDIFFTKSASLLRDHDWSEDLLISADSKEGQILKDIFDVKPFEELYVNCSGRSFEDWRMARKVTPTKDGFIISKRRKNFKFSPYI